MLDTGVGLLGVPPAGLAEVLPMPALERRAGGAWCAWRGRHLAVLPRAVLMGCGDEGGPGPAPLLAVLAHEGLVLGLPVEGVRQLRAFGPGLAAADGLTATVHDEDGVALRLLAPAALFRRFPEAALSRAPAEAAAGSAPGRGAAGVVNASAHIVFDAGGLRALPLEAVERIVPLAAPAAASMAWDGATIPLVDLRPPASAGAHAGHVLLARGARGLAGYVVTRVESLIPAGSGHCYRLPGGTEFITAGGASYRIDALVAAAAT